MAIEFPKLQATAPSGAVIGMVGDAVDVPAGAQWPGPPLETLPALEREKAYYEIGRRRRAGETVVLMSQSEEVLSRVCDEVWWVSGGKLAGRGAPEEVLNAYRADVAARVRAWGETLQTELAPRVRRGDGRAKVVSIELLGENGAPTIIWRSGELAVVRVTVRFEAAVENPVVGVLIRNRIGLNVYGTNTELEGLKFGPAAAGQTVRLDYAVRCELCAQEYTLTVASHDPDGTWHDWLEDAVAFSVVDTRYTAGVANLRATVRLERG